MPRITLPGREVRVWFGTCPIITYEAPSADAPVVAASFARHYIGLPITIDGKPFASEGAIN